MLLSSPYFCAAGNARKGKRKDWSEAKNGESYVANCNLNYQHIGTQTLWELQIICENTKINN